MFTQESDSVLVRLPGSRRYSRHSSFSEIAKELWEYAALCENSYLSRWDGDAGDTEAISRAITDEPEIQEYDVKGASDYRTPLDVPGWNRWEGFPSPATIELAEDTGLYVEVMEKSDCVAVVFRGTEFTSWRDWRSNLRWFRFTRFLPFYKDQYTVVAERIGNEFVDALGNKQLESCRVVATGHSLGGGLAQHFAYSLPAKSQSNAHRAKVSRVYAFDPSPVTGWSTAGPVKHENATGLKIDRAFEHGEVLAYLRLLISYVKPPPKSDPSVREIRFNVVKTLNPIKSHSMRLLAVALMQKATES